MTVYNGTAEDDVFEVQSMAPGDQFFGGEGFDKIVLKASPNLPSNFNGLGVTFESIEQFVFEAAATGFMSSTWDYFTNPLDDAGTSIVLKGGSFIGIGFSLGSATGDFTIPNLIIDSQDYSGVFTVSLSVLFISTGPVTLRANENIDAQQSLGGGAGNDTLIGHSGADGLTGGDGADMLYGMGGHDTIVIGSSLFNPDNRNDFADGGDGVDFLMVTGSAMAPVMVNIEHLFFLGAQPPMRVEFYTSLHADFVSSMNVIGTTDNIITVHVDDRADFDASSITFDELMLDGALYTSPTDTVIELYGNGDANTLIGHAHESLLYGEAGDDMLIALGGEDILDGGSGNDSLHGGGGNDTYYVDAQGDLVFEDAGEGTDSVFSTASFYLYANIENLTLAEGAGNIFGVGNDLANTIQGNEGENLLLGGAGDDTIRGGGARDAIFGEDGADKLYGGAGIDYLVGGDGNDRIEGGADADEIYGQDGDDTLIGGASFDTDILVGGAGNDILRGDGGMGDFDLMDGGAGDDTYYVDTGDDKTFEAQDGGTDTVMADVAGENNGVYLYQYVENLVLIGETAFGVGNELANDLTGNDRGNYLLGGEGDDWLDGGAGNDVLFGEEGADTFHFAAGTGGDVIADFDSSEGDVIDLSAFGYSSFEELSLWFIQNGDVGAINLQNGDFIVLHNVVMDELTADDFVL